MRTPFPIAASIAQRPGYGGHAVAFLQFAWGLDQLGYQPVFIDRLGDVMATDEDGSPSHRAKDLSIRWFLEVMEAAGLEGSYCLLLDDQEAEGLSRSEVRELIAAGPGLLNVMGFLGDEELLEAAPLRIFLDVDPGFPQLWDDLGLADSFAGHDRFVTVGGNVGKPDCAIPSCGLEWVATRPPVCLERWPVAEGPSDPIFRTIGSWRGPYDPIEHHGSVLGLRVHEFRKFFSLPERVPASFEVALDIDPADSADRDRLRESGWQLAEPLDAAGTPVQYQRFVQTSTAEIGIAKNIYVDTNSGWFSDRSACFLASGKPVLAQDTGFREDLPAGEGLIAFASLEEAVEGAKAIIGEYGRHSQAARALAEEFFDSRKVISGLLADLGIG